MVLGVPIFKHFRVYSKLTLLPPGHRKVVVVDFK